MLSLTLALPCCLSASICQFVTLAWRCGSAASCTWDWRVHIIHFNVPPPSLLPPLLPSSIQLFCPTHHVLVLHSFFSSLFSSYFFSLPLSHPSSSCVFKYISLPHSSTHLLVFSLFLYLSFSALVFKLVAPIHCSCSDKLVKLYYIGCNIFIVTVCFV